MLAGRVSRLSRVDRPAWGAGRIDQLRTLEQLKASEAEGHLRRALAAA